MWGITGMMFSKGNLKCFDTFAHVFRMPVLLLNPALYDEKRVFHPLSILV
jgi:hypothetical protein